MITLPQFVENKQCTVCPLHEGVDSTCIPTIPYNDPIRTDRAVLIVGDFPDHDDDKRNRPFSGRAGLMLRKCYIQFFNLEDKADIYLTNTVRCRPPQGSTPNATQVKLCQGYVLNDIAELQKNYAEVIILTVGGPATKSLRGISLKKALSLQGQPSNYTKNLPATDNGKKKYHEAHESMMSGMPQACPTFSTYHPNYLLREPSVGLAVKAHLQMLVDYLEGNFTTEFTSNLDIWVASPPPRHSIKRLSLDIETYGLFKNQPEQTMFHPARSEYIDKVHPSQMIRTVGLTWRDMNGEEHHTVFRMQNSAHRRRLWAWFRKCKQDPNFEFMLGQNIAFDLMYLRYCYPECKYWLDSDLPIMDLMITNYLHDEGRPEKSLKNLAPLFNVTRYDLGDEVKRYTRDDEIELRQYNCQDTFATLRLQEILEKEIRSFYSNDTTKLSGFCYAWYSDLLWLIIWMSEEGLKLNGIELEALFDRYKNALTVILEHVQKRYNIPLRGKGSELAKRTAMRHAYQEVENRAKAGGFRMPKLILTKKKKTISFSEENRNILMNFMPNTSKNYKKLKLMGSYQNVSGMLDRYLYPLLVGRGKDHLKLDTVMVKGIAHPRWFPVPSEFEDSSAGGTKQARIVAKGPACQTFPPAIKNTITGRFDDGWLLWYDYSQIELRAAALLSNDPVMMDEYTGSPDFHTKTAKLIFGDDIVDHPNFKSLYRQAGKTLNFLMLYRGGAFKFQETLMRDIGLDYPIGKCNEALNAFKKRHARLFEWQDELIRFVGKNHYYELPLLGQSRLFTGGRADKIKSEKEIANLPVQATAANISLSAQYTLWKAFKRHKMTAIIPINIYDAGMIECKKHDLSKVKQLMQEILPMPPYYRALCDHLGRELPLACEASIYRVKNGKKILTEKEIQIVAWLW